MNWEIQNKLKNTTHCSDVGDEREECEKVGSGGNGGSGEYEIAQCSSTDTRIYNISRNLHESRVPKIYRKCRHTVSHNVNF